MNTKINLTYKGVNYTLEYDRMSVKLIESQGFNLQEFTDKPMTNIDLAWTGAFIKNHKNISQNIIDEIYADTKDKTKLIQVISTMISECYTSLMTDDDSKEGNVTWEVVGSTPTEKK